MNRLICCPGCLMLLVGLIWLGEGLAEHLYGRMAGETSATQPPIRRVELILEINPSMFNGTIEAIEPVERDVMVMGTIEALDPVNLSLVIHTDFGRLVTLVVSDPGSRERLAPGDRVRFEVDEQGRPARIQKLPRDVTGLDRQLTPGDGPAGRPGSSGRHQEVEA